MWSVLAQSLSGLSSGAFVGIASIVLRLTAGSVGGLNRLTMLGSDDNPSQNQRLIDGVHRMRMGLCIYVLRCTRVLIVSTSMLWISMAWALSAKATPHSTAQSSITPNTYRQVLADGRDPYRLRRPKLLNRQLERQVEHFDFRRGRISDSVIVAADTAIGGQAALGDAGQSRYHGYFLADGYLQLQPLKQLAVNLNVLFLNPSASDGFRFSSDIHPGLALRLTESFKVAGKTLSMTLMGIDLDWTTIAQGLLIEETPLEGHMAHFEWGDVYLREVFGGRVYWDDDDVLAVTLGWRPLGLALNWVRWLTDNRHPNVDPNALQRRQIDYFTLSAQTQACRVCVRAEAGVKLQGADSRLAALLKADWLVDAWQGLQPGALLMHLGYQGRYYSQGFGPRGRLLVPTTAPQTPQREASWVTNAFEYYQVSDVFHQYSHTAIAELRWGIDDRVMLLGEAEVVWRQFANRDGFNQVVISPTLGRLPTDRLDVYYRAGIQTLPYRKKPHLLRVVVTNKLVDSGFSSLEFRSQRFFVEPVFLVEAEAFL